MHSMVLDMADEEQQNVKRKLSNIKSLMVSFTGKNGTRKKSNHCSHDQKKLRRFASNQQGNYHI